MKYVYLYVPFNSGISTACGLRPSPSTKPPPHSQTYCRHPFPPVRSLSPDCPLYDLPYPALRGPDTSVANIFTTRERSSQAIGTGTTGPHTPNHDIEARKGEIGKDTDQPRRAIPS
ncbi:hypothetical protein P280DRAFT_185838 [Massarina eburnea CBS 473.64]|uniref:Uncharacterized protein n=1 Tax=Massarina eburnea CBS 473.64 TaxID=1395130 RepID=A0A6A6SB08_9PLEO|nr:hypothetical protein P280DRAFT_185838 [Massarina eburnea CBS 473.64]